MKKFSKFYNILILFIVFVTINKLAISQIVGGRNNSESSPKKVEAAKLSGGDFVGDVNLLNGSYNSTIPFGKVSTPAGVGFSLNLEYSSGFSFGGTKPMCSGIPYGEGWELNIPSISVESDVYNNFALNQECPENDNGNSTIPPLNFNSEGHDASNEGDIFWFSPTINIPGRISGRAIFKYYQLGDVVFVLNKFETSAEIRLNSDGWKVILSDGTIYHFELEMLNYRAPSNKRVLHYDQSQINQGNVAKDIDVNLNDNVNDPYHSRRDDISNVIEPKEATNTWYCSQITNLNYPQQSVRFEYEPFGVFDYFKEFQQSGYGYVNSHIFKKSTYNSTKKYEACREVILTSVSSFSLDTQVDIIELEYKTLKDAIDVSSSNGSGVINFKNVSNNVGRLDSLYSYQSIYLKGGASNFTGWKGYQHWKYLSPNNNIQSHNPYLNLSDEYYRNMNLSGATLPFNHSFLESERLNNSYVFPGDIYEIRTKINKSIHDNIAGNGTVDIAIVTGDCGNTVTQPTKNSFVNLDANNLNNRFQSTNYELTRGIEIFSTFNMALKWQIQNDKGTITTSNFFVMPNIPATFNGFNIQVGPGNSDIDYARKPGDGVHENGNDILNNMSSGIVTYNAKKAYPFYSQLLSDRRIKSAGDISHNFGIGLPWSMMVPVFNSLTVNEGSLNGNPVDYDQIYNFWWQNTSITNSPENRPSKFGSETTLEQIELLRYAKNPYMLQGVKVYHINGEIGGDVITGKILISQKKLEYGFGTEMVIENYPYKNNENLVYNANGKKRTIILLKKIIEVPSIGNLYATDYGVSDTSLLLTTRLQYSEFYDQLISSTSSPKYLDSKPFIGHKQYLLTTFIDHLGGITQVTYYEASNELTKVRSVYEYNIQCSSSIINPKYGSDVTFTIHPVVQYIDKNDENDYVKDKTNITSASLLKRWEYTYANQITTRKGFSNQGLTDHFRNVNFINFDFVGYQNVVVYSPYLMPGVRNKTTYEYYGNTGTELEKYLYSGKLKRVANYDYQGVLQDEKITNYSYTQAFINGYKRPNFIKKSDVNSGYLLLDTYEYEDIYKNQPISNKYGSGEAIYFDVIPQIMSGSGQMYEKPKMLEFYFYNTIHDSQMSINQGGTTSIITVNPDYLFHSYFIKKTEDISRDYEKSFAKSKIMKTQWEVADKVTDVQPHTNSKPKNPIIDREINSTLDRSILTSHGRSSYLIRLSPLSDEVLIHFVQLSDVDNDDVHKVLAKQNGLSDEVWLEVIKKLNTFSPSNIKDLITIQSGFSNQVLSNLIVNSSSEINPQVFESFFLKNEALSPSIIKQLATTQTTIPGESFTTILKAQNNLDESTLKAVIESPRLNDNNLLDVLGDEYLSDNVFSQIIKNRKFTQNSIPTLFEQTPIYPSDNVVLEVLKRNGTFSESSLLTILKASPREKSTVLTEQVDKQFSCDAREELVQREHEQDEIFDPTFNVLKQYCGNDVITSRKFIETKTSYEYYEADYTGKAVGRAFNVLMSLDQGPRTITSIGLPNEITITKKDLMLKHEPSWSVFSTKTSSPHLVNASSEEQYFYLYDLQNQYDRYWYNYDFSTGKYVVQYFNVKIGTVAESEFLTDSLVINSNFSSYDTEGYPTIPRFDGMDKARQYGNRELAFQKTTLSKNQNDKKPLARSEYYFYDSRWKFDDFVGQEVIPFNGSPCPTPTGTPTTTCDGNLFKCQDCYTPKIIYTSDIINKLPLNYCAWKTKSVLNGFDIIWYCPISATPKTNDPTAELIACNDGSTGSSETNNPYLEQIKIKTSIEKRPRDDFYLTTTLNLRSVTIQVDTLHDLPSSENGAFAYKNFMNSRMSPKNTYIAEFVMDDPMQKDAEDFYAPYKMLLPYKDNLTVRTIKKRNRYLQPAIEENQVGLKTRYYYESYQTFWHRNSNCFSSPENYASSIIYNIGMPTRITIGYKKTEGDSLVTTYVYNNFGQVSKVTDPTGKYTDYTYDNYHRLATVNENGTRLLASTEYNYWNHDQTLNFEQRRNQNFAVTTNFNSQDASDISMNYSFVDPLGRKHSEVVAFNSLDPDTERQIHSGKQVYDNWNRVNKSYKNVTRIGSSIVPVDDISVPFSETLLEKNSKGRMLRAANYGVDVSLSDKVIKSNYSIVNNSYTACELGINQDELELIMGKGVTDNCLFYRTEIIDQDNKHNIDYKNAFGQKVATLTSASTSTYDQIVTLFGYDSYGNLNKVINPAKQVSTFQYNILGQLVKETTVDEGTKRYMYNKLGLVSAMQDDNGRTHKDVDGDLQPYYRVYKYDLFGRLISTGKTGISKTLVAPLNTGGDLPTPLGYAFCYDVVYPDKSYLDNHGQPPFKLSKYPHSDLLDAMYYSAGFIGKAVDEPLDLPTDDWENYIKLSVHPALYFEYVYSNRSSQDWLASYKINHNGESQTIEEHTGFDNIKIIDLEKSYIYLNNGNLASTNSYNNDGKVIQVQNFGYDSFNSLVTQVVRFNESEITSSSQNSDIVSTINYTYNYHGLLKGESINFNGKTNLKYLYVYNAINNLIEVKAAFGNAQTIIDYTSLVTYNYDLATGKLISKKQFAKDVTEGAVTSQNPIVENLANKIDYQYDIRDRLTSISSTMNNQKVMDYLLYYDNQNPAQGLSVNPYTVNYSQNYNGNINGTSMVYNFGGNSIQNTNNVSQYSKELVYGYTYDKINRLTFADASVGDFINSASSTNPQTLADSYQIGDETITYDVIGNIRRLNRIRKNDDIAPNAPLLLQQSYAYGYQAGKNRLNYVYGEYGTPSRNYTYDAIGNLLTDDSKGITSTVYGRSSYVYSMHSTNESIDYLYDANDGRIFKKVVTTVPAQITQEYYLNDIMGRTIAIYDMNSNALQYIGYGIEREVTIAPLASQITGNILTPTDVVAGQTTFYVFDHLGNTRITYTPKVVDNFAPLTYTYLGQKAINTIANVIDYYPYGKVLREYINGNGEDRYLTTYHERDQETGYDNRGARLYDSEIARFLSVDPLAHQFAGWSPYNFCFNNPIMFIDPDGRAPSSTHTDKNGNVIAVYNDGDLGVYKHGDNADGGTPTEANINSRHEKSNSAGGEKMGTTKYWDEFLVPNQDNSTSSVIAPNTQILFGKDWQPLIDWGNNEANRQDLTITRNESKNGGILDIKTNLEWAPESSGGVMTGRLLNGQYSTARSAGNYLAGMNGITGTFQGQHISGTTYMKLAGAYQQKKLTFLNTVRIVTYGAQFGPAPYYGEMNYSGRRIAEGIQAGKNVLKAK